MRILITGISGLLGSNLAYCYRARHDVLGTYRRQPLGLEGIKTIVADLADVDKFRKMVLEFSPAVVIHGAALADVDLCEKDKALAHRSNVLGTQTIVTALKDLEAKLVYISTDSVYPGDRGKYVETDPVGPVNYYGQTKLEGEAIARKHSDHLIVRTAFFGWNAQPKKCFAEWVVGELSSGRRVKGFVDVKTSFLYTFDLADLLETAFQKDLKGIYHFGAANPISKHDFAVAIARDLQLDSSLIDLAKVDQSPLRATRPKDLSLDVAKLSEGIGRASPSMKDTIRRFCGDYKRNIPGRFKELASTG